MEIALENNMLCLIIAVEEKYNIQNILSQECVKDSITVHQYWCHGNNTYVKYDYPKEDCNLLYNIYGQLNILRYLAFEINKLHANKLKLEQIYEENKDVESNAETTKKKRGRSRKENRNN